MAAALVILLAALSGCGGKPETIALGPLTAPAGSAFQSGAAAAVVLNTGNKVVPTSANLTLVLIPVTGGTGGASATPTSLDDAGSGNYLVHFTVPTLPLTAATSYGIVASGGSTMTPFSTSPALVVTIQPAPLLQSVAPATAQQGSTVDVTLTGVATSFINGTTQASFGTGIAVGGGAAGSAGVVQVTNATTAVAHLVVGGTATVGAHDISVTTGAQILTLPAGFTVTAAQATPVPPVANAGGPYSGTAGTAVSFTGVASTDALGRTLTYAWNFGDSAVGTGVSPTHIYAAAGTHAVTLTVTNTDGLSSTAKSTATIAAAPQPPVANAGGPYSGTAATSIAFSAAASSDPRGQPLTFAWNFGDGGTGTGVAPSHAYAAAGTFTVTVTAKNADGLTAAATAAVTVKEAAQPPVASAGGPYTSVAGAALLFSGAASTDPKGQTLTYAWNFGDGSQGTGVAPAHTYAAAGTYTLTLTIKNTDGLTATATATVTITAAASPQPPVANAGGPYTGAPGAAITFNGSGSSDPKSRTLTYAWNFGDGGTSTGVAPTHTYAAAGSYKVTLKVSNADALSASATTMATVTAASSPLPPVANAGGPYTGAPNAAIAFNGSASSDPKGQALTYAWTFGDGGTATGATPAHAYATAGSYTVTLTVRNTDALTASYTTTATITALSSPQPPVARAGGPYTGAPSSAITFSGSGSSDPRGETLTYVWTFGDGTAGTGVAPTHVYTAAGSYTVNLTVTNTDALFASSTTTATITAPPSPQPPVANAGGPYTGAPGVAIVFSGAGSSDPRGGTLTYAWTFGDGTAGTGVAPTHRYVSANTYTVTLTVTNTDNLSAVATATATVTAPSAPQAPVANAGGPYTGTPGTAVAFNGSASSDPRGEALTYAWNFGDGSTGSGVTPTHAYGDPGNYTVTLTVTNTDSLSATATTTAAITASAQPPLARVGGPYTGTTGASVRFDGSASTDPASSSSGFGSLTFAWNFGDGTQGIGPLPVHTYAAAGTFPVTLTVTNRAAATATATGTATITQGAPVADLPNVNPGGPYTGARGAVISLSGAGSSDPAGTALTYTWDFGDGASASGIAVSHAYAQAGTYSVGLTANNGTTANTGSTTATITAPPPLALQARAGGPYTVAVNQPLTFDGTASTNPNSRQLLYTWDFGDGSNGTGGRPTHIYASSGSFTVTLVVSDGLVSAGTATAATTVTGPAAEAIVASAGGPYTEAAGRGVTFDATASRDNLGNPLTYAWTFGDGATDTGATPTHTYAAAGSYTATVVVTSGTATASATATVSIANAVAVTITSPTANTLFGTASATVTGTVNAPNLTVSVNGTAAAVSGTSFIANNVSLREGVNLITATATDGGGGVGSGVVSVILDVTAPRVSITSPLSGAVLTTSQVAVAGLVNDSVTGTIGSNDVTVTVNGIAAQVANRSYLLPSLQLVPGTNTLTVVVRDRVGNTSQTTGTVQLVPPSNQLSLLKLSGDNQTGAAHAVLDQPLVVQLVAANGTPVAGRPITFTVSRSDGNVEVMPTVAQTLYVTTDAAGKASVLFQLGTRSGLGVNQVSASTPGAAGAAVFTATSTTGAATQIHVIRGENQRGLLGTPLAEAFQVIVQDAYGNPVPGATVNYTVGTGDGTLPQGTVTTDSNGKAGATLTLGQQEGIGNYTAQANFVGNTGLPVTFAASGFAAGPVANTSVSGIVLDNANVPVVNATVKLLGTSLMTVTDASGRFKLTGAPVGTVTLSVDGSTSASTETLPFLSFVMQDLPGQENTLGKPVYLPRIDVNNGQTVGGDDPVTLTIAGVPGVGFTVAPHSVTFPDGSTVGKLSLSLVKSDMVPMEPTAGSGPDLIWTLQPAGTRFSVPVQVTLPNTQALPPGLVSEMYQYDHDLEQFVSIGTGHVSADGSVIVSDSGFGITKAGWGHGPITPIPGQCTLSCTRVNECITSYVSRFCTCDVLALTGHKCGLTAEGKKCKNPGNCTSQGLCDGTNKPNGLDCHTGPEKFCDKFECHSGECTDVPVPDQPLGTGADDAYGNQGSKGQFAFKDVAKKIGSTLTAFGAPVEIKPILTIADQVTLICCESKKQLNVKTREQTYGGGINISTKEFPVYSPVAPFAKLGMDIPRLGYQGVFAKFDGDLTGSITWRDDECTDKSCFKGGFGISINGTVGLNLQASDVLKFTVSGSTGFGGSAIAGCGSLKSTVTFSGLNANVQITFLDLFQVTASTQLLNSTLSTYEYPF